MSEEKEGDIFLLYEREVHEADRLRGMFTTREKAENFMKDLMRYEAKRIERNRLTFEIQAYCPDDVYDHRCYGYDWCN